MTTQETAKYFGVPLPETCQELAKHNEFSNSLFYWYKNEKGVYEIGYTENIQYKHVATWLKAPQMNEIAEHLPSNWTLDSWANQLHFENYVGDEPVFLTYIQNHQNNYAEAFAQLFLRLRKEGLI